MRPHARHAPSLLFLALLFPLLVPLAGNALAARNRAMALAPEPAAASDTYSATSGVALSVAAPGVLANDTSPGSLPLTAVLAAGAGRGALALNADGSFTYTSTAGYVGTDSFTYRASNGTSDSTAATVAIHVGINPMATGLWMGALGTDGGVVTAFALSPAYTTDRTVFAGTSIGVFRSTDGGVSWQMASEGMAVRYVLSLAVSPGYSTDRTLFAGIGNGFYRSTDGAATWQEVGRGGTDWNSATNTMDLLALSPFYPTDATIVANSGAGFGPFVSPNGGAGWLKVNFLLTDDQKGMIERLERMYPRARSVAFSPAFLADRTIFLGTDWVGAYRSTNGGATWQALHPGVSGLGIPSLAVSPAFSTDRTIYAGTTSGISRSTDGGDSWQPVLQDFPGPMAALSLSPAFPSDRTMYAATIAGMVFRSTDAGVSWQQMSAGFTGFGSNVVALSPTFAADRTMFLGAGVRSAFRSTDGGASWQASAYGLPGSYVWATATSPAYAADHTLFAGTSAGMFRSADGGASWQQINGDPDGALSDPEIRAIAVSPAYSTDRTLFAGTLGGGVYRSKDGGATWQKSPLGMVEALAVSPVFATDRTLFAGVNGQGVFRSTDAGDSWLRVYESTNATLTLLFSPAYATDRTIYAGTIKLHTGTVSGLLRSVDGGNTWQAVSIPFSTDVYAIALSPSYATDRTLFAGTSFGGVFRSTDAGASWQFVNQGIPTSPVTTVKSLALSPAYATDRTVYAGTTHGVYRSPDGGITWQAVNQGLPDAIVYALSMSPSYASDHTVFAGTYGVGAYKRVELASGICGDLNNDGSLNILDVIVTLKIAAGVIPSTPALVSVGDLSKDGKIDVMDALAGLQYITRLVTQVQCG